MKKLFVLAGTLFLAEVQSAHAQGFWKDFGRTLVGSLPKVESPFLRQMGFDHRGTTVVIVNNMPFYGRVVAGAREVAKLGPGDVAFDTRRWNWIDMEVPILFQGYRDPQMTQYLGVTGRIFRLTGGSPSAETWTISIGDLQTPDGTYLQQGYGQPVYPAPDAGLATKYVPFPREWWNGMIGNQIVNNTLFTMHPRVNGQGRGEIPPSQVFWLSMREFLTGGGRPVAVQIVFTDRGRWIGGHEFTFQVPNEGIQARQEIVGPYNIRR